MTGPSISDLQLELLAQGALDPNEEAALRAALESDARARARFEALAESNAALLRQFPADEVNAEVARRVRLLEAEAAQSPARPAADRRLRTALPWGVLAASTALLLFALLPTDNDGPGFRSKGTPHLLVHRITEDSAEQLTDGDLARQGDRIQLSMAMAGRTHAVVVSIDGTGHVTLHFPRQQGEGEIVGMDTPFSLPTSYRLDDAPGFERFILVTAGQPLDTEEVLKRARELATRHNAMRSADIEDLPEATRQDSFLLTKGD